MRPCKELNRSMKMTGQEPWLYRAPRILERMAEAMPETRFACGALQRDGFVKLLKLYGIFMTKGMMP